MPYFIVRPQYKKKATIDPILNNNDWATIQKAAQDGVASQYWSVGDRKAVVLNGSVGDYKTFSNYTCYAYILGFNHNSALEGNNTIHFQFGFDALTDGNHIAFCASNYGSYGSTSGLKMKTSNNNSGGWESSYMRNTVIPAFINVMPSDLQSALKAVNKYTDNASGSSHNASANVTATSDKVFLLSEYEVHGSRDYANQYEQNSQAQYDYYKNGGSKVMYNDTSTSTDVAWWERSPGYNNGTAYCNVSRFGRATGNNAYYSYGFAPAFVVG